MRDVTLTLTNPSSVSYWDVSVLPTTDGTLLEALTHLQCCLQVESNVTVLGLTLFTAQELWTQGAVTAVSNNSDSSVQITVQTDQGYNHSIW